MLASVAGTYAVATALACCWWWFLGAGAKRRKRKQQVEPINNSIGDNPNEPEAINATTSNIHKLPPLFPSLATRNRVGHSQECLKNGDNISESLCQNVKPTPPTRSSLNNW